jgi:hypothetical protein
MKPSRWDKQLETVSPLKNAAIQSGQTNHPSKNKVGLDASRHAHLSLEGTGESFLLDILFHRMSANAHLITSFCTLVPGFAVPRACNNHLYFRVLSRRSTGKNSNYCGRLSFSA